MNHQFEPVQTASPYIASTLGAETALDPRIEDYLDHVCAPMIGKLSYEERLARRTALRQAMEPVIAAHIELGALRDEAVELTLAQLRSETETAVAPRKQARVRVEKESIAFKSFGTAWIVAMAALFLMGDTAREPGEIVFLSTMFIWAPLAGGIATELRGSKTPFWSMWKTMGKLAIPTLLVTALWSSVRTSEPDISFRITAMLAAGWSVFGSLGIGVGKLYRLLTGPDTRVKILRRLSDLARD